MSRRALTVQGWLNVVLISMGVVVLIGGGVGAVLLTRTDEAARTQYESVGPARVGAYQLQAALRDQEMAVRGYIITADTQFVTLYNDGIRAEAAAAETIRRHVGDRRPMMADLDAIETAAAQWRSEYAEQIIAGARPAPPPSGRFDLLRTLFDTQNAHMNAARNDQVARIATMSAWRDRALVTTGVAFALTAVLLASVVHNAVSRPLAMLAAACRHITRGNFGDAIEPQGPPDIRAIAIDVDDMRQRIVDELEAGAQARARLDDQAAELRRSNGELEQFAYVASHDLQEPLRKVASFCQLLEKRYADRLDERGLQYLHFAVDGAKRMQRLINDLLTFSRVGRLNIKHPGVALDATLDEAITNLATALEESGARIDRPDALPEVTGDATLLTMMWQNLIGNAIKFRRAGLAPRVTVECRAGTGEHDGAWVLSVSDNGIGIGDAFVDKVFVIFQRLHSHEAYSGTGIGLALVKKIVEYHRGSIWIDTGYTDGTRFCFTLPVASRAGFQDRQLEERAS